MRRRTLRRWKVGLVATLALFGVGLLYANATLLAATLIPLAFVFYGALSTLPEDVELSVTRELVPKTPHPGGTVEVRITVENVSDSILPDVRLVDGVPNELAVSSRSPRLGVALSPGESRTVTYSVIAKRGTYRFDDPLVRCRSLAGVDLLTKEVTPEGDRKLVCVNTVRDLPVQGSNVAYAGTSTGDSSGSGLEFHSTRQYKHGDPVNRIDWHHVAKTGELITVKYLAEKTDRAVVLLDARPVGRVVPQPGYPTGVDFCAYAGERLYQSLERAGVYTSVAAFGVDGELPDEKRFESFADSNGFVWMDSDRKTDRNRRVQTVFDAVYHVSDRKRRDFDSEPVHVELLLANLPPDAQILLCSPVLDDWPIRVVRTLAGEDYSPLVLSPDIVRGDTPGQRIVAIQRRLRLQSLERLGATTTDWNVEQPLRRSLPHLLSRP